MARRTCAGCVHREEQSLQKPEGGSGCIFRYGPLWVPGENLDQHRAAFTCQLGTYLLCLTPALCRIGQSKANIANWHSSYSATTEIEI